jgi:hypothetical protein
MDAFTEEVGAAVCKCGGVGKDDRRRANASRGGGRIERWAGWVAASLLILAASIKLAWLVRSGAQARLQLLVPSLVVPFLSEWLLIKLVIAIEYLVACAVLLSRTSFFRFSLIAWLATVFLAYHLCLDALGHGASCHCLGYWGAGWQTTMDKLALILLAILLGVGWGGLAAHGWRLLYSRVTVIAEGRLPLA